MTRLLWFIVSISIVKIVSGQDIPKFLVEPSDTNVVEYSTAEIACSTTGNPAPTVTSWMKDGVHLRFDGSKSILTSGTLRISFVSRADAGYYQCVAKNRIASVISKRAKLNVAYFDQIFSSPIYVTKNGGTSFVQSTPSVSINPLPKSVYRWKKNGVNLVEDSRISFSKDNGLYIADLNSADAGRYTCEVENPVMKAAGKSNAQQTVKIVILTVSASEPRYQAPSLLKSPIDVTARQGLDLSKVMECFPNRSDTTITWRRNGAVLYPSTKYRFDSTKKRLTIMAPERTDEGQYSCESAVLTNRVSGSGQLHVIVPPAFLTSTMVTNLYSDNSTMIWCNATAYPSYQWLWFHNAKRVLPSADKVVMFSNGSLLVRNVAWVDGGVYQCVAQNDAGQAIALTRLNIQNITARIAIPLRDSYFHVGSTAVVPCYAVGAPKPRIRWLRNGLAIPPTMTRISTTAKGYLQITNSIKSDSGRFTCVANNDGVDAMSTAYVGIVDPTVITKGPNATTIAQRAITVWLPCEVRHDPTVNVTWEWRKNTGRLYDPRYSVLADGRLQIVSTQQADAATFTCHVFSPGGNATVSTVLTIVSLPLSPSTPTASNIGTNSLTLSWLAPEDNGGIQLKDYELQIKNETGNVFKTIKIVTQLSVQLTNLLAGVKYAFRVAARNELGRGRWSDETTWIPMRIEAPSRPPTNVHVVSTEQTKIELRWTPPPFQYHNGKLRGYNVYYRGQGYKDSAFTIRRAPPGALTDIYITYSLDNLLTFTVYEIKVAAFNDAGVGVQSTQITAETKPGIPSVAPTEVSIDVLNGSAASVSYKAPRQIYWNGHLIASRGYAYSPERPLDVYTYDAPYNHATRYNQTFIMMGLKPSTDYALRVAVVTASGAGPKSKPVYFKMQEGSPGAPRNFIVTATYAHSILLRWSAPYVTNGILRGFKVGHRKYERDREPWIHRTTPEPAGSGGAVYRNLELNTRYEFYVLAFTNAGDGPKVFIVAQTRETAPTLPGQPTKPVLVENNGTSITLSWVMDETGGTLMSYYLIEANNQTNYKNLPEASRQWYLVVNLTRIQDIPTRIKNLTTNTVYRFRVTPVNSVGRGPTSNVSEDILSAESRPSSPPTNLRASAVDRQSLLIEWVPPPKYTWGSSTIFYKIKLVSIGKADRDERIVHQRDSQARQYTARGLAKWTRFNVTIAVYNAVGYGPTAWPVTARTAEDVPDNGPATITPVAVSSSVVNVSWTPVPVDIRNGIILGYYIYYNIRTEPLVVNRKPIIGGNTMASVLTGLAGYATYQIRMSAYTKTGEGKKTDPVEVITPDGIAGKPYKVRFPVVRTDFVQVTWLPPLRPNGAIVSYEVQHKLKDTTGDYNIVYQPRVGPNILSADVNGLIGNRYYVFRVYAKTRLGRGNPAEEIVFTTPNRQVPESPVMLPIPVSDVDATTVLVKWKPRDDGKSPIRSYTLQYNKQPDGWKDYLSNVTGRVDIDAFVNQLLVTRLIPSSSYNFRIKATNDVGDSAWSQASNTILTHHAAPKGAPRNLKIRPLSPSSLRIDWEAPTFEDLGGLPVEFLLRYKEQSRSEWSASRRLPRTPLYAVIKNLKGYTKYDISMAAKNDRGTGPWTEKTGITGESPPTAAPTNIILTAEDASTIKVRWTPPLTYTIRGNLLGYKIEYQRLGVRSRRRRRRSTDSLCPAKDFSVKTKFASPYVQEETIKNVGKFSRFKITVRAYNGAGDGPKSGDRYVNTPEGTPSPPIIIWTRTYINDIDIQWKMPCSPNGYISAYQRKFWQLGSSDVKTQEYSYHTHTDRMSGLKPSTEYKIQLKAATRGYGFGDAAVVTLRTRGPFPGPVLPGSPGKPKILSVTETSVKLSWQEGTDGNSPIVYYKIQYAKSGGDWRTGWDVRYDQWGRNGSIISYTLNKLDPDTQYLFRVIAENRVGASLASDAVSLKTNVENKKPFHAELWFILLIVVVAILIVALLILFICLKRRRNEKSKYATARASDKPGLSSFELAMVRDRRESGQRLLNSDTASVAQSSRSLASQASKKPKSNVDRKSTKDPLEERSSSTMSKHSEPSDNDADKSGEESEEEGKLMRGAAAAPSIASHYANDPFYKNWRNSLDKKTRKAILTEYHDKNKAGKRDSVDSFGSRPHRSASEEGLDRIARPRVRPGRADLSEKKKLAQSDPYLNQEPAPSVSSFTPSGEGDRPPRGRPGRRPIDRAAARSEPSLNAQDSDSDPENGFPPPYEDEGGRRRKNSFLRATKGSAQSLRKGSLDNLDDAGRAKRDLVAELDKAANYYTRAPPPYEENSDFEADPRSPPAYTPRQDSSDDSRPNVGYNRAKRNWRPQRQNGDRRDVSSPMGSRDPSNREDDDVDGPSRTSMTLV
ncbi:protein sidekick-2-like isoform X2 [Rhopilema esculentum]|uniref:protein sidekick-2-like isoform X2 n=1 Tax=Rhopilema esculentum TaxID=499914 RepID=UPI0031E1CD72